MYFSWWKEYILIYELLLNCMIYQKKSKCQFYNFFCVTFCLQKDESRNRFLYRPALLSRHVYCVALRVSACSIYYYYKSLENNSMSLQIVFYAHCQSEPNILKTYRPEALLEDFQKKSRIPYVLTDNIFANIPIKSLF